MDEAAQAELDTLRRWKAEAIEVIQAWERVWEALGRPGKLGESKAAAALAEVERLRKVSADDVARTVAMSHIAAERDAALAEVERLRHELDQRTDPEPDPWYITKTGPEFHRRDIIVGPFSSRDDALLARSAIEQRDKPLTYWICPAARLLGGDQ